MMKEVNMGTTLYDMNKQLIKQGKPLSKSKVEHLKNSVILPWICNKFESDVYFFMMLCHDRRDYTLFATDDNTDPHEMADIVIECLDNRDFTIYSIAEENDGAALEIWVGAEEDSYCYYLFPYDEGVIKV